MGQTKPSTAVRFQVGDAEYEIDAKELSLGEVAEIERHFDCDYDDLFSTQATLAIVFTAMRRVDPALVWGDVEKVSINGIKEVKAKRPTRAAPAASGTRAG